MPTVKQRKKQKKQRLGFLLIGIGATGLVALVVAYIIIVSDGGRGPDHCPTEGHDGHTVVLIDSSDPVDVFQRNAIEKVIENTLEKLPTNARISVFFLSEAPRENATPVVSICNPGSGEEASWFGDNPRMRERVYQSFVGEVRESLQELGRSNATSRSPILETIQALAVVTFRNDPEEIQRRFVVFSDLIQNSANANRYEGPYLRGDAAKRAYGRLFADLIDVEVDLWVISRPTYPELQTPKDMEFWEYYFLNSGARVKSIRWVDR